MFSYTADMAPNTAVAHLEKARASLQAQRDEIDEAINDVDRALASLNPNIEAPASANGDSGQLSVAALRAAICEILSDYTSRRASTIHEELVEAGHDVGEGRVRGELVNMEMGGLVHSAGRGWFTIGRS